MSRLPRPRGRFAFHSTATTDGCGHADGESLGEPTHHRGGTGADRGSQSLNATQAKALEAELKAIERELDQLDLPSDSDFSGIESELP